MNIIVLNGSPKGGQSVTLRYVDFIKKKCPAHTYTVYDIAQKIRKIEQDDIYFQEILNAVQSSDFVLWAFPLYVLLVASQYKRFIELLFEKQATGVFKKKHTAVISTSIHFYDHTAHNYLHAICDDLEMNYIGNYSAAMHDLLLEKEREKFLFFAENMLAAAEQNISMPRQYRPLTHHSCRYTPSTPRGTIATKGKKIVVLTDEQEASSNIARMVETCRIMLSGAVEVINLYEIDIKGGCLGCIHCGYDNTCIYEGKDEFVDFFKTRLLTADILVFAGSLHDRYLSSRWKMFFDRAFFNTHQPSFAHKQIAYIVSGPLQQLPNVRQILEAYTEIAGANLVGIISDETDDSQKLDASLYFLLQQLVSFSEKNYIKPKTFLGIGGMKIFRDDIWGSLRFVFQGDHTYYKKHGIYDFPQKDYKTRIRNRFMLLLMKIPPIRKNICTNMRQHMLRPYQEFIATLSASAGKELTKQYHISKE